MATQQTTRRRLRRPSINLEITPIHRAAWTLFRHHHYLDTSLSCAAKCFCAFVDGEPAAFSAWIHRMIARGDNSKMIIGEHRTVVLPDFQGLGIGNRLSEFVASVITTLGKRARSTTSHPAMIRYRSASPKWNRVRIGQVATPGKTAKQSIKDSCSVGRITAGFEYVGPKIDPQIAAAYWNTKASPYLVGDDYQQLINLIDNHPGLTIPALIRRTGRNSTTLKKQLTELVDNDSIRAIGRARGADRLAYYPAE